MWKAKFTAKPRQAANRRTGAWRGEASGEDKFKIRFEVAKRYTSFASTLDINSGEKT
jgi:hypothetical protein